MERRVKEYISAQTGISAQIDLLRSGQERSSGQKGGGSIFNCPVGSPVTLPCSLTAEVREEADDAMLGIPTSASRKMKSWRGFEADAKLAESFLFTYLTSQPPTGGARAPAFKALPPVLLSLLPAGKLPLDETKCQRMLLRYLDYFDADLLDKEGLEKTANFLFMFGGILATALNSTIVSAGDVLNQLRALVGRQEYHAFRENDTVAFVMKTLTNDERRLSAGKETPDKLTKKLYQQLLNALDEVTTHAFLIDGLIRNLIPTCQQVSADVNGIQRPPGIAGARFGNGQMSGVSQSPSLTPLYFLVEHAGRPFLYRTVLVQLPGNKLCVVPFCSLPIDVDDQNQRLTESNVTLFEDKIKAQVVQFLQPVSGGAGYNVQMDLHTFAPFYREFTTLYDMMRTPVNYRTVREPGSVAKLLESFYNRTMLYFVAHVLRELAWWTPSPAASMQDSVASVLDLLEDRGCTVSDVHAVQTAVKDLQDYIRKPVVAPNNNIRIENGYVTRGDEAPEKYDLEKETRETMQKVGYTRMEAFYKKYQRNILFEYNNSAIAITITAQRANSQDLLFQIVRGIAHNYQGIRDQIEKLDGKQKASALSSVLQKLATTPGGYIIQQDATKNIPRGEAVSNFNFTVEQRPPYKPPAASTKQPSASYSPQSYQQASQYTPRTFATPPSLYSRLIPSLPALPPRLYGGRARSPRASRKQRVSRKPRTSRRRTKTHSRR